MKGPFLSQTGIYNVFEAGIMLHLFSGVSHLVKREALSAYMLLATANMTCFAVHMSARAF